MKTAEEMFEFYYGVPPTGILDKIVLRNFKLIEQTLEENEEVLISFIAMLNYKSLNSDGLYSCAITNKRIIIANDIWIKKIIEILDVDEINDVKVCISLDDNPKVILSTPEEELQIHFLNFDDDDLAEAVHGIIFYLKTKKFLS